MAKLRLTFLRRAGIVAAALAATPALADPPHSRARQERVFRDWRLDCAAAPCVARTILRASDGSELVALEASGAGAAARLALRTPLPLLLPDGATLALGDDPPRPLAWRTCRPDGCEAVAPLDDALLAALRRERAAEVTLTLEDGVQVRLPVSLLGFTAARRAADDDAAADVAE